jgi:ATP-dependent DNA ligase
MTYPEWASLAVNIDDLEYVPYPTIAQPKLNGIRAKWDHKEQLFISRQCKHWRPELLPGLYNKMKQFKDVSFDGELYCHRMSLQDINSRVSINALEPHEDVDKIDFHPFDIISTEKTTNRQKKLEQYPLSIVPYYHCSTDKDTYTLLDTIQRTGYEGLMVRLLGLPYIVGRSMATIKIKSWKYAAVTIIRCTIGEGKNSDRLGRFYCKLSSGKMVKVGGGHISDMERLHVWNNQAYYIGKKLNIRYRDLSNNDIPQHPQMISIPS